MSILKYFISFILGSWFGIITMSILNIASEDFDEIEDEMEDEI